MRIALSLGFIGVPKKCSSLVVVIALSSASVCSVAQKSATAPVAAAAVAHPNGASACPLDMHVRQGVGGNMMAVDKNGAQVEMFAQRLKLLLNDLRREHQADAHMVEATVTVHGTSAKGQILPADTRSDASGEIVKTLTVRLTSYGEPEVSGDIRLPGFTSTSMIDLESVTYDDGSTWKLSGTDTCHVPPDMVMRVGN